MKLCTAVQEGCGYKDTLRVHRYFAPLAKYFTVCITYQPAYVLSSILLEQLKEYLEEILGEYQCGFRPGRRTTDQIFTVWQILQKFYAYDIDLHLLFIDFKKAFNSINKKKLYESLVSFVIPRKIKRLVKMTLEGAQAKVIVDGKTLSL
jgi:sorting nexin-29